MLGGMKLFGVMGTFFLVSIPGQCGLFTCIAESSAVAQKNAIGFWGIIGTPAGIEVVASAMAPTGPSRYGVQSPLTTSFP